MKYYNAKLSFFNYNDRSKKITSRATGNEIPNANYYFNKMKNGDAIPDAPIFDYFFLESYDKKKYWERYLLNVYGFSGEGSQISAWFVSEDLKQILENFTLSESHHFYPSKLLYKGRKIDYYIFQFEEQSIIDEMKTKYVNWGKSVFLNPIDASNPSINTMQEFIDEFRNIMQISKYDKKIILKRIVLNTYLDFFPMRMFFKDNIVSERLKTAIEEMGITGFEFSELDYEVVVE